MGVGWGDAALAQQIACPNLTRVASRTVPGVAAEIAAEAAARLEDEQANPQTLSDQVGK